MNITSDDPRLTAYVLDELDRDGCNFIENEMQRLKEYRFEARELADFTDQLRAALATEPMPELPAIFESAIAARLQQTGSRRKPFWVPVAQNLLLKTELAFLTMLALCFVLVSANLITPVTQVFAKASTQMARVMLQVAGTHVEWQGSSLLLPGPARPAIRFQVLNQKGNLVNAAYPTATRITIDLENLACHPLLWTAILLSASLLAGNLYLRSLRRKLLLAMMVVPLAVLSDALRRFVVAEWLVHTNAGALNSPIFVFGQPIFVVFSLLALIPLLIWLRRSEQQPQARKAHGAPNP